MTASAANLTDTEPRPAALAGAGEPAPAPDAPANAALAPAGALAPDSAPGRALAPSRASAPDSASGHALAPSRASAPDSAPAPGSAAAPGPVTEDLTAAQTAVLGPVGASAGPGTASGNAGFGGAPGNAGSAPSVPMPFAGAGGPVGAPAVEPFPGPTQTLSAIEAQAVSAWFGTHKVLERVSLTMPAGQVTALIGPSGCGKSTFLRILNRLHELVSGAALAGSVLLDGHDIYDRAHKVQEARKDIGMVFQRPNPFPAMSIYDNVLAGLRLTGRRVGREGQDLIVETSLTRAGLWAEVKDRLRQPGGSLSGGQQQRLCIARSLAVRPKVLLMDEPCSALDPTSTRVIEETMGELQKEVTIVIVTHNMQQAQRVSQQSAFFLAAEGAPGVIVEHGDTDALFNSPRDQRTADYVSGRFG
jgi:phosphate transport system ATP-binding protein